jgi:hypothetical protein
MDGVRVRVHQGTLTPTTAEQGCTRPVNPTAILIGQGVPRKDCAPESPAWLREKTSRLETPFMGILYGSARLGDA